MAADLSAARCLDPEVCNFPNGRCVEPSRCDYPRSAAFVPSLGEVCAGLCPTPNCAALDRAREEAATDGTS